MIAGYQASQGGKVEDALSEDEFDALSRFIDQ